MGQMLQGTRRTNVRVVMIVSSRKERSRDILGEPPGEVTIKDGSAYSQQRLHPANRTAHSAPVERNTLEDAGHWTSCSGSADFTLAPRPSHIRGRASLFRASDALGLDWCQRKPARAVKVKGVEAKDRKRSSPLQGRVPNLIEELRTVRTMGDYRHVYRACESLSLALRWERSTSGEHDAG